MSDDDVVLYAVRGRVGEVTLNRPRAINALDQPMVDSLLGRLEEWAQDDRIGAVFLRGAGDRGLCAGGDVRALRQAVLEGRPEEAMQFWRTEYRLDAMIATYPKPVVAWMDGITMGGGIGLAGHAQVRLATERSSVAMPETIIGFFPDVGGMHLLARAPGELGTYAALTGLPVTGADAVAMGLADAVVGSDRQDTVLAALVTAVADGLHTGAKADLLARLLGGQIPPVPDSPLLHEQHWIDECYAGDDAAVILQRLRERPEARAREAAEAMAARSPHSVAVTLEALRRAADLDVHEVLAQDYVLCRTFLHHPDFAEGVRAQLVDKDRSPRWTHGSVADVDRREVLAAFEAGEDAQA